MKLIKLIPRDDHKIGSLWQLTLRVGWNKILEAGEILFADLAKDVPKPGFPVVYVDDKMVTIEKIEDLRKLPEAEDLCIVGYSKSMKLVYGQTFYNQTGVVGLTVDTAEKNKIDPKYAYGTDYESFNKFFSPYMDYTEILMYCPRKEKKQDEDHPEGMSEKQ